MALLLKTFDANVRHLLVLYRGLDIIDAYFDSRMRLGHFRTQQARETALYQRQWAGMRLILRAAKKWPHLCHGDWHSNQMMVFNARCELIRDVFISECLNDDKY